MLSFKNFQVHEYHFNLVFALQLPAAKALGIECA
jgi:hypothetical protein